MDTTELVWLESSNPDIRDRTQKMRIFPDAYSDQFSYIGCKQIIISALESPGQLFIPAFQKIVSFSNNVQTWSQSQDLTTLGPSRQNPEMELKIVR